MTALWAEVPVSMVFCARHVSSTHYMLVEPRGMSKLLTALYALFVKKDHIVEVIVKKD